MDQRLNADIVSQGKGWVLSRVETSRDPLLGALVRTGSRQQVRVIESGGLVSGDENGLTVYGVGHRVSVQPETQRLFLCCDSVEWVLASDPGIRDAPAVEHKEPSWSPVPLPLCDRPAEGLPDWAKPWSRLPQDVATWASELDIRGTSLTQRVKRVLGVTPKQVLAAVRATIAWELAGEFRGRFTDLAIETGYSSQAHLSHDISKRFGVPLRELTGTESAAELDWLKLMKSANR